MPFDVLDRILRPLRVGPVTSRYPGAPPDLPPAARGLPELDAARCDGTAACVTACPTSAIGVSDQAWSLDIGACIGCAACVWACPHEAIRLGGVIELAVRDPEDLVMVVERDGSSG